MQTVPIQAGGAIPRPVLLVLALSVCLFGTAVRADLGPDDYPQPSLGRASYYGYAFAGRRTAMGTTFRPEELTAAHRSLPLGTRVRVTNLTTIDPFSSRSPTADRTSVDAASISRSARRGSWRCCGAESRGF